MPTHVLGISAFYHDSAACLLRDGDIVAAAQEERFTRKKHDPDFPQHAVQFCFEQAGIAARDLDFVAFYDKPILKFHRLLETFLAHAPKGLRQFGKMVPVWVGDKLHLRRLLTRNLGCKPKNRYVFCEHHESHAASAFFPSPYEDAAIVTMDGVGEWATSSIGVGEHNRIRLLREIRFPHSVGLLYSAFTYYCGFRVNSGEYKLMGLAPYGEPRFEQLIREHLIDLREDGSYRLDLSYFDYCVGARMTGRRFHQLFGGEPRQPESPLEQRHMDLAASVQKVTEDVMLKTARHAHASEYFDIAPQHDSPYMLVVAPVRDDKRKPVDATARGLDKLKQLRSVVPAVTHVDFSARLQTVDDERNPRLAALLRAFEQRTGCPVLINTSFNVRGEPIVCTPQDALRCFLCTEMDVLVLENFVIRRAAQTDLPAVDRAKYLDSFGLD